MNFETTKASSRTLIIGSILIAIAACGGKPPAAPPTPTVAPDAGPPAAAATTDVAATAAAEPASQPLAANATTWSPEALEDLLAPVALFPDAVLAQVLVAATNPQEVLDAGNWMVANPNVKGKELDTAVQAAGFTVPMRALMQFPEVVDKLCLNMPWTEELGQAYVNDQQGVMDAVQRLRVQAKNVGTLKSSPQMKVATEKQPEGEVIALSSPDPKVVNVPQYDPVAAYAPPGGTVVNAQAGSTVIVNPDGTTTTAPATTTTTTTTTTGHSTGSMVATGLLSFGAGLLVANIFDDDDNYYNRGYYGNMWYHPMPYYPPYPYRPRYGNGYYPGNSYNRPNNYIRNGNNINVNINQNNNYFNRYNSPDQVARNRKQPRSPISTARPNRPELQQLNAKAAKGPVRRAPTSSEAWKGKGGYAGNDPKVKQAMDRSAAKGATTARQNVAGSRVQGSYAGAKPGALPAGGRDNQRPTAGVRPTAPKVQGGYAGAKPSREVPKVAAGKPNMPSRDAARPSMPTAKPNVPANRPNVDRGRPDSRQAVSRPATPSVQRPDVQRPTAQRPDVQRPSAQRPTPAARPAPKPANRSAVSSGGSGRATSAASARGKQSMPPGGAAKARAKPQKGR